MRHRKKRLQLNRFTSWRKATIKSLTRNLLLYERIKTTLTKAKAAKVWVDKLISLAKDNGLSAKRQAFKILGDHKLVRLLFNEIANRFKEKTGGYTRILRLNRRRGDNAQMVILELTAIKKVEREKPKKERRLETKPPERKPEIPEEKPKEESKPEGPVVVKEKPTVVKKPTKHFLGGLRKIFKKERDSL
ncbi:MAG: 50S ribosomal protein L17 [Candidatus Omnitrophica bacterium]|nr:50S ribosomal protein L17 [Candidatus Omnitrophota bacterium]